MNNKIKNVLITGAAKRIGASIANSFAAKNWNLALHYNKSKKETKLLLQQKFLDQQDHTFEVVEIIMV